VQSKTEVSDLVSRARLTDDEGERACSACYPCSKTAEAQLSKALYEFEKWLEGWKYLGGGPGPLYGAGWEALREFLLMDLKKQIEASGMERPE